MARNKGKQNHENGCDAQTGGICTCDYKPSIRPKLKNSGLNQRLFDASFAMAAAEGDIYELLLSLDIPHERTGWDNYDNSLELYGVPPDYRLSDVAVKAIFDAGFAICYVNHTDKWETHYSMSRPPWRVSYPHKRNDGDSSIWLEEPISTWPSGWLTKIFSKQ